MPERAAYIVQQYEQNFLEYEISSNTIMSERAVYT